MNNLPRETLCTLVAQYGHSLCEDPRRCEGLLRDFCGEHRREINLLIAGLKEHVAADLVASRRATPKEVVLTRLVKRLCDNLALTEDAAQWTVESWALALGVVTDAEPWPGKRTASTSPAGQANTGAAATLGRGANHGAKDSGASYVDHRVASKEEVGLESYEVPSQTALRPVQPSSPDVVGPGRYILNFFLASVLGLVVTIFLRNHGWLATWISLAIWIIFFALAVIISAAG